MKKTRQYIRKFVKTETLNMYLAPSGNLPFVDIGSADAVL